MKKENKFKTMKMIMEDLEKAIREKNKEIWIVKIDEKISKKLKNILNNEDMDLSNWIENIVYDYDS